MARLERREFIDIQSKKIREIAQALICAGYLSLDDQASALGLPRSTTWTILHAKHKKLGAICRDHPKNIGSTPVAAAGASKSP